MPEDSTIESFVDDIARRSKMDPAAAETAVGTILSVIQQEGIRRRWRNSSVLCQVPRISLRNTRWSLALGAAWAEL